MANICALCHNVQSVTKQKREREFSLQRITKQKRKRGVLLQRVTKRERAKEREREGGGSYSEVGLQKLKNTELGQLHKDKPAMFASLQ